MKRNERRLPPKSTSDAAVLRGRLRRVTNLVTGSRVAVAVPILLAGGIAAGTGAACGAALGAGAGGVTDLVRNRRRRAGARQATDTVATSGGVPARPQSYTSELAGVGAGAGALVPLVATGGVLYAVDRSLAGGARKAAAHFTPGKPGATNVVEAGGAAITAGLAGAGKNVAEHVVDACKEHAPAIGAWATKLVKNFGATAK